MTGREAGPGDYFAMQPGATGTERRGDTRWPKTLRAQVRPRDRGVVVVLR
ncbi:hypothetical protein HBH88_074980 [Parastagonospora nodorum]|nr:hypothetical protein HBH88_074980 [Parastagonospora nodorum]